MSIPLFAPRWLDAGRLALGPAPRTLAHLQRLQQEGIVAVLSLCSTLEAPPPPQQEPMFACRRLVLPDRHTNRPLERSELEQAMALLKELQACGAVYVHCRAGVERSPLLCVLWVMREWRLPLQEALEYVQDVNPASCPLAEHLGCLQAWGAGAP